MKRWKFRTLVGALLVSFLFTLTACGNFGAAHAADNEYAPLTIKISTANGEKDVKTVAARKMKEELEARSGGKITVEVYPSGPASHACGIRRSAQPDPGHNPQTASGIRYPL
jgi:C4-dicarboxylate-binding protein DctP